MLEGGEMYYVCLLCYSDSSHHIEEVAIGHHQPHERSRAAMRKLYILCFAAGSDERAADIDHKFDES